MRRFRGYVGARMHRRLFGWFGVSILLTGLVVGTTLSVMSPSAGGWPAAERIQRFTSEQFSAVWDDVARRDALAASLSRAFDIDVRLTTPEGGFIGKAPDRCDHRWFGAPIERDGRVVGQVELCGRHPMSHWRAIVPLLAALLVLWAASGRLARRLSRPLYELVQVARDLGNGRLSSRARLGCRAPGEIGMLSNAFNDMAERIERQIADQRELLAGVSHELRTPLARVRLLVELMRESALPDRLDEVEREVVEMDALVGELLANARLDFAALDRRALVAVDVARKAVERAGEPGEKLASDVPDARIEGDPTLLARALANLIDNARRHGQGVAAVRVTSRRTGTVAFEVDDAGPGFPAGSDSQLFRAFAPRADGRPREPGSLGLGLALVRRIAEAHGGRAYAENRATGGGRVGIELPALGATPAA